MDALFDTKTIPALLVFIVIFLCAGLVKGVIEFLWTIKEKKDSASESAIKELTEVVRQNTAATEHLEHRLSELESSLNELPKFKTDMRRLYAALKLISGDKWAEIRKEIMEEENPI